MIKIEKLEAGYFRCQSCNTDGIINIISLGLTLNNTSSFRLCDECLNSLDKIKKESE